MRILYLYPSPRSRDEERFKQGLVPENRFYGLLALRRLGHVVDYCDGIHIRSNSLLARIWRRHDLNPTSWRAWRELRHYDVVVVKDMVAVTPALLCRLQEHRCLFVDCFQQVHRWQWPLQRLAAYCAERFVVFSEYQRKLWAHRLGSERVRAIPFGIDVRLFQRKEGPAKPEVLLCVGTDKRKDYRLFAQVAPQSSLRPVFVTSSRRVADEVRSYGVDLLRRVTYQELCSLYARAIVVIPVLPNTHYPSGLTVLLEALAMGSQIIAARTPILEEYVSEDQGVLFYEPGNVGDLLDKMCVAEDRWQCHDFEIGPAFVQNRYSHERMDEAIAQIVETEAVR